jgi:hypothetical protein
MKIVSIPNVDSRGKLVLLSEDIIKMRKPKSVNRVGNNNL